MSDAIPAMGGPQRGGAVQGGQENPMANVMKAMQSRDPNALMQALQQAGTQGLEQIKQQAEQMAQSKNPQQKQQGMKLLEMIKRLLGAQGPEQGGQ